LIIEEQGPPENEEVSSQVEVPDGYAVGQRGEVGGFNGGAVSTVFTVGKMEFNFASIGVVVLHQNDTVGTD